MPKEKINLCRMNSKITVIYVISRYSPQQNKFSAEIRNYLKNLKCNTCWIYEGPSQSQQTDGNIRYIPIYETDEKPNGDFLKQYQQKLNESLPQRVICLIIDVSLAQLKLPNTINGLLLGSLS
jgi:hypothetical protein